MNKTQRRRDEEVEKFLAVRKEAAKHIDPATAEVCWGYRQVDDPYDVLGPPGEAQCIGRMYFARAPGSEIWVNFDDLSPECHEALEQRSCSYEHGDEAFENLQNLVAHLRIEVQTGPLK